MNKEINCFSNMNGFSLKQAEQRIASGLMLLLGFLSLSTLQFFLFFFNKTKQIINQTKNRKKKEKKISNKAKTFSTVQVMELENMIKLKQSAKIK